MRVVGVIEVVVVVGAGDAAAAVVAETPELIYERMKEFMRDTPGRFSRYLVR